MKIVSNFTHIPGNHCGSTAIRDVLRHIEIDLSEAMCFGLGSGLGFSYYRRLPAGMPSRMFHGRTGTLERDLCARLALDLAAGTGDDADRAWQMARTWLDANVPVLLTVELSHLPYYHTHTLFPGHRVVLVGYDDARGVAFIADNEFANLQTVAFADLRTAWQVSFPLFPLRNEWLVIKSVRQPIPLEQAIRMALRHNARAMIIDREPHERVMGMETLAEDLETWGDLPDWEWCAKFGYQMIERRGTGGGLFRKMYADYVREAEALIPELGTEKLSATMAEIAEDWTVFALVLKRIADEKDRTLFAEASRAIRRLALCEENFWGRVMDLKV